MNRTALEPCRPLAGRPARDPSPAPTHGPGSGAFPPIYAQLAAEWRARGRAVPDRPDVQWASFADLSDGGDA
ncbi:hypothetical protein [Streptomyces guryensis]|uniref:Uncharacterized protein n=1 Tax=Streptomyces guryensis TaxID=2886947 RepID=A0A9Q3ZCN6_9ACTN|nr:hypothetical protein [Streptomyces guryensis]MCD9879807.1 hypothetical protein [Streptomyces guryensis]